MPVVKSKYTDPTKKAKIQTYDDLLSPEDDMAEQSKLSSLKS
jgi:hypothetical protein